MKKNLLGIFWTVLWISAVPFPAASEVYTWEDSSGAIHFTDDLGQVPEAQRRRFQDAPMPTPTKAAPESTRPSSDAAAMEQSAPAAAPSAKASAAPEPQQNEAYWRKRVEDTRSKLESAQRELDQVYQDMRKNLESGPGMQERKAQLAARETELKDRISRSQQELDSGIAEEAQKAGAPPGWLR